MGLGIAIFYKLNRFVLDESKSGQQKFEGSSDRVANLRKLTKVKGITTSDDTQDLLTDLMSDNKSKEAFIWCHFTCKDKGRPMPGREFYVFETQMNQLRKCPDMSDNKFKTMQLINFFS